ncbi:MAG: Plug domain-containing protein, partial [Bacteroidia bacterium]|nr:Plug domain-containing protein [Bacteroidia bacterium]
DLAQYLQVVPGVVFTGDQGGQLFVRGGTPIQNFTLLDGAIVYSAFHTLGLFSVFDTDYIRGVDVYTAGFGAEYGSRVSSVMDIRTRNGDFQRFRFKVHSNTITSGGMVEGPLFKKRGAERAEASFLVSARGCYINRSAPTLYDYIPQELPFSFYDLYAKTTVGSAGGQVSVFGFHHADRVDYGFPTDYRWTQTGGGANYVALVPGTAMTLSGSVAGSLFENQQTAFAEALPRKSRVGGFNARFNFAYVFNSIHELTYGARIQGFNTDFSFINSLGTTARQQTFNTELAFFARYKHVIRSKRTNA